MAQLNRVSVRRRELGLIDSGAFQSLAEFSIALAGFTGVVVIFSRGDGGFHPADRFRMLMALVPSLVAAFLAHIPVGLELTGLSPELVWRVSSLVLVAVLASEWVSSEILLRQQRPESRAVLLPLLLGLARALRLFPAGAGLLNATGLLFTPQPGAYFFSLVCLLLLATLAFVRLLFVRPAV